MLFLELQRTVTSLRVRVWAFCYSNNIRPDISCIDVVHSPTADAFIPHQYLYMLLTSTVFWRDPLIIALFAELISKLQAPNVVQQHLKRSIQINEVSLHCESTHQRCDATLISMKLLPTRSHCSFSNQFLRATAWLGSCRLKAGCTNAG